VPIPVSLLMCIADRLPICCQCSAIMSGVSKRLRLIEPFEPGFSLEKIELVSLREQSKRNCPLARSEASKSLSVCELREKISVWHGRCINQICKRASEPSAFSSHPPSQGLMPAHFSHLSAVTTESSSRPHFFYALLSDPNPDCASFLRRVSFWHEAE